MNGLTSRSDGGRKLKDYISMGKGNSNPEWDMFVFLISATGASYTNSLEMTLQKTIPKN